MDPAEERRRRGFGSTFPQPAHGRIDDKLSIAVSVQFVTAESGGGEIIVVDLKTTIQAEPRLQDESTDKCRRVITNPMKRLSQGWNSRQQTGLSIRQYTVFGRP